MTKEKPEKKNWISFNINMKNIILTNYIKANIDITLDNMLYTMIKEYKGKRKIDHNIKI